MGKKIILIIALFGVLLVSPQKAIAEEARVFNSSGLPIPRFISLRSDKVFVRTGPALRYPIKWVFQREDLPVEVIQEFDTWRKIRDHEGQEGWIHQSLTQGKRFALVQPLKNSAKTVPLYRKPEKDARLVALLEEDVIVKLEECSPTHCKVVKNSFKGWIERKFLYGIYDHEKLD